MNFNQVRTMQDGSKERRSTWGALVDVHKTIIVSGFVQGVRYHLVLQQLKRDFHWARLETTSLKNQ